MRKDCKSLIFKVPVKCEGSVYIQPPHDVKAYTINQAKFFPMSGKQGIYTSFMVIFLNPFNPNYRKNVFIKNLQGTNPNLRCTNAETSTIT